MKILSTLILAVGLTGCVAVPVDGYVGQSGSYSVVAPVPQVEIVAAPTIYSDRYVRPNPYYNHRYYYHRPYVAPRPYYHHHPKPYVKPYVRPYAKPYTKPHGKIIDPRHYRVTPYN